MNELNIFSFTCKGLAAIKFVFEKTMCDDEAISMINGRLILADGRCNGQVKPKESTKNL